MAIKFRLNNIIKTKEDVQVINNLIIYSFIFQLAGFS